MSDTPWPSRLHRFFAPPVFADQALNRRAALLNGVLLIIILLATINLVVALMVVAVRDQWPYHVFIILAALILRHIVHAGRLDIAAHGVTWSIFAVITVTCLADAGLYAAPILGYTLVIILAALLLGEGMAIRLTGASVLSVTLMAIAFHNGVLQPEADYFQATFSVWALYVTVFALSGGLLAISTRLLTESQRADRQHLVEMEAQIAERERVERNLERFFLLSVDPMVISDRTGLFVRLNPALANLLGYTESELLRIPINELIHPDDLEVARDALRSLIRGKTRMLNFDMRLRTQSGAYRRLAWRTLYDGDYAYSVGRDVTSERTAEMALRDSEERLRLAMQASGVVVWKWDMSDDSVERFSQSPDIPSEKIAFSTFVIRLHPEDREVLLSTLKQAIETREIYICEYRMKLAGKEYRWMSSRGRGIYDEAGTLQYMIGVTIEIEDRRARENERVELAVAQERAEFLSTFLAEIGEITHDLKAPLSVINTSLYFLDKPLDDDARRSRIVRIQEQTGLMTRYIQNILTISQLERGERPDLRPLDLHPLIRRLHHDFTAQTEAKSQRFTLDLAPESLRVAGDEGQLQRALANLIENALHYTPNDGAIHLLAAIQEADVVVEIVDSGIGIPQDDLAHIFERFFRASNVRTGSQAGTGLGLAIVRKIAEAHGGSVRVSSAVGQGSRFQLRLPLLRDDYG